MKQTVVGVFDSALRADETLHVLVAARFDAERLPRIEAARTPPLGLLERIARRFRDFMDADMYLPHHAGALAQGRFVVKVRAGDDAEALAAHRVLLAAGGREIDLLADEWVDA